MSVQPYITNKNKAQVQAVRNAKIHNGKLTFAKLPVEIRRRIMEEVLTSNLADGFKFRNSRVNLGLSRSPHVAKRMTGYHKRKNSQVSKRTAANRGHFVVLPAPNSNPISRRAAMEQTMELGIAHVKDEMPLTESNSLLCVDAEIFYPIAREILIIEREWTVSITALGFELFDLPLIPRLDHMDYPPSPNVGTIFGHTEGVIRFKDLKNLVFNLYAPGVGDRIGLLNMFRNVQYLAKLLERNMEEQSSKKNRVTNLTINLCIIIPKQLKAGSAQLSSNQPGAMSMKTGSIPNCNSWFTGRPDFDAEELIFEPGISALHDAMAMEIVTLPLRRLRNVPYVKVNVPKHIARIPNVVQFQDELEAELSGSTNINLERERLAESKWSMSDELAYRHGVPVTQNNNQWYNSGVFEQELTTYSTGSSAPTVSINGFTIHPEISSSSSGPISSSISGNCHQLSCSIDPYSFLENLLKHEMAKMHEPISYTSDSYDSVGYSDTTEMLLSY